jgi:hypothetical protein
MFLQFFVSPAFSNPLDLSDLSISERDLAQRALALYAPEHLSIPIDTVDEAERAHAHDHVLCGTLQALALRDEIGHASPRTKETLAFLFKRPRQTFSKISSDGRFMVHYNKTGAHAVNPTDADQNGHPDYVDTVADVFDEVWRKEVDDLGYQPPPSDSDGLYDIYIRDLSSTAQFGVTFPESLSPTTPSYIEIENNFTDPVFTTQGIDALRFTAAHEFFHAIQFSYYLSIEAAWWYELTSTWMQDRIVTDVNDHHSLVAGYLAFPEAAIYEPPPISFRPYGAMIMGVYLTSVYGENTIRSAFEDLASLSPGAYRIEDTDHGLPGGFAGFLPRYWVWNYLTGTRAVEGGYYPEASAYDEVKSQEVTPIGSLTLGGDSGAVSWCDVCSDQYVRKVWRSASDVHSASRTYVESRCAAASGWQRRSISA